LPRKGRKEGGKEGGREGLRNAMNKKREMLLVKRECS
jgi:hypothetical protein